MFVAAVCCGIFVGDGVGVGVADGVVAFVLPGTASVGEISASFAILSPFFTDDSSERVPGVSGVMYRIADCVASREEKYVGTMAAEYVCKVQGRFK